MSEGATNKKARKEYTPADPGLSVDHVAKELGVTRSSARRMIVDGTIPHYIVRAGRRKRMYRVRRSVLIRWIESQERQSVKARNRRAVAVIAGGQDLASEL
jgi:excisionase family DNA binding protein